ncbi:T9SS type A sorting domain-containing protein [Aquirufa sp. OSTEICH-129V]|uniref:T9SS type A sorting domain-containing protein n=1 Tax=Aquirufa avitistagni TaxID=3104728 RepID=A0ABW6DE32_9BACT
MGNTSTQSVIYTVDGSEHMVTIPGNDKPSPSMHFINKQGNWVFEGFNSDVLMDGARNYSFMDKMGTFAYSNTGTESIQPWPLGEIVVVQTKQGKIVKKKISTDKAFFHSVATGDMNNDGLVDVVGMHMGTLSMRNGNKNFYWGVENFIPYTQNKDGSFTENQDIIADDRAWPGLHGAGAIIMADLMGDSRPELIKADYGFNADSERYSLAIFAYNPKINKYQFVKTAKELGVFSNKYQGATSIIAQDFNKDGFLDLAVATEGQLENGKPAGIVQIWWNDKDGNLSPGQSIVGQADLVQFREFEVGDVDGNGWVDIILHAGNGTSVKGLPGPNKENYLNLKYAIWLNSGGKFTQFDQDLLMNKASQTNGFNVGPKPSYIKGFLVNGKLKFYGFEQNCNKSTCNVFPSNGFNLYEATITFCNPIKPQLSVPVLRFCSGDSTKALITNSQKGDSFKWFAGEKLISGSEVTKSIKVGGKLFVIKKDSLGCEISSDTLSLTQLLSPETPTISREGNTLISSFAAKNQWYVNNTLIPGETTQKIKATDIGNYSVRAIDSNGCISGFSGSILGLITSIAKEEAGSIVIPNPFTQVVKLNFKSTLGIAADLKIYNMVGSQVGHKPNVIQNELVDLSFLPKGNYLFLLSSKSNQENQVIKVSKE